MSVKFCVFDDGPQLCPNLKTALSPMNAKDNSKLFTFFSFLKDGLIDWVGTE